MLSNAHFLLVFEVGVDMGLLFKSFYYPMQTQTMRRFVKHAASLLTNVPFMVPSLVEE